MAAWLRGFGGIALFLLAWELLVRSGLAHYDYLPAPDAIAAQAPALVFDRGVFGEIGHTLGATLSGWAIAVAIGLSAGIALGLSPTVRSYGLMTVELLRPLPAVALIPLALLLFGFSIRTELLVIVIPSIWPVLVNTMAGVASVSGRLTDVARSLRLTHREAILKIFVPAAASPILVGCRLSMTTALVLAVVAEMIGNPQGIGNAVVREAQALQPAAMFAYVLIAGLLGIVLNLALLLVSRLLLPGEFGRSSAFETAR
jgi:sulfonate transport system permease protein